MKRKALLALIQKRQVSVEAKREVIGFFFSIERKVIFRTSSLLPQLDVIMSDPTRLLARKGALERMKKEEALQKQAKHLPHQTEELVKRLQKWEEEEGKPFTYEGERYLDTLHSQQNDDHKAKEDKKRKVSIPSPMSTSSFWSPNGFSQAPSETPHVISKGTTPSRLSLHPAAPATTPSRVHHSIASASSSSSAHKSKENASNVFSSSHNKVAAVKGPATPSLLSPPSTLTTPRHTALKAPQATPHIDAKRRRIDDRS